MQSSIVTPSESCPRRNFLPGYTPKAAYKLQLIEDWGGSEAPQGEDDVRGQDWDGESTSGYASLFLPPLA